MRPLPLARTLRLALLGLTIGLAILAALGVAGLYGARQDYEDELERSYRVQTAAAALVTATVIEESARGGDRGRAAVTSARRAARRALAVARRSSTGDPASERLVARAALLPRTAGRGRRAALRAARDTAVELADRQAARREDARTEVQRRSRRGLVVAGVAGALALLAALALVSALVAGMRRPLERLVAATRRLAEGDLDVRVVPDGPAELRALAEAFNAMAADLQRAAAQLFSERRRMAVVIESLGDALVVCDADGTVQNANPRACELAPELAPGTDAAADGAPLPPLADALEGAVRLHHRDRTLEATAARLGSDGDGVVWTLRDVTERERLEQLKTEFVATASHELRSPLTSIKGFAELLQLTPDLAPRQREWVDAILLSANRLVDLVNDLLDVTRIQAGRLEIHPRPMDLRESIDEVVRLLRPRIAQKRQQIEVQSPRGLAPALADPARVRQIVTNLVTNAHLYTEEGGRIAVHARLEGDYVALAVSDTGRGIPAEDLSHVFERFYRGGGGSDGPRGTGLGLAIVKSLVDMHGGSVSVRSQVGAGSTFVVCLPRLPAGSRTVALAALEGRRVLVVDDEPEVADVIAERLRGLGVEPVVARSGEEALERLRADRFDAMTLDILMPGMSGFDVLAHMRADADLRDLPVVVVTAVERNEALASECVVNKPVNAAELAEALSSVITSGRSRALVVARAEARGRISEMLDDLGVDHDGAGSAIEAAQLCEARRYEVALVDAALPSPEAVLRALDLRGRRLNRTVIVFSAEEDNSGLAQLDGDAIPLEDAAAAVLEAVQQRGTSSGGEGRTVPRAAPR